MELVLAKKYIVNLNMYKFVVIRMPAIAVTPNALLLSPVLHASSRRDCFVEHRNENLQLL
jgi:hypothetical protein